MAVPVLYYMAYAPKAKGVGGAKEPEEVLAGQGS
jgi:hypothetical protein